MKLTTKRFVLRPVNENDAQAIIRNINNLNVAKRLLVVPYPYTLADARYWINHCKDEVRQRPRKAYNFAIDLKTGERYVGAISLAGVDRAQGNAELGYWLAEDYWRQGIMKEAANRLIRYGFERLHLKKIRIPVFATNNASAGLAQSVGGEYKGVDHKLYTYKATGKKHKEKVHIVTPSSWRGKLGK